MDEEKEKLQFSDIDIAGRIMKSAYLLTHDEDTRKIAKNFTKEQIMAKFKDTNIDINHVERVFDELKLAFCRFSDPDGKDYEFRFTCSLSND